MSNYQSLINNLVQGIYDVSLNTSYESNGLELASLGINRNCLS